MAAPTLPPDLERYLATVVHPSSSERARLLAGGPVTKVLDSDSHPQVAVFGAIWINAPMQRYVEAVRDIETFEQGRAFKITRRISAPPRLADFADLRLSDELVSDLSTCRIGDCDVKLDARMIAAFQTGIDWDAPGHHAAAEALMRRLLFEYTQSYLIGGNSRLPLFHDKAAPLSMGSEFRAMVDDLDVLTTFMPHVRRYLLDFPREQLPGASSYLYWQETEFGLKPTLRLSHLTISAGEDNVLVTSKMIYANHYFRSALELRLLLPDPARGPGFWFVTVVSSRTDGMTGFTGIFVRHKVRSEAREGTTNVLVNTRRRVEAPR